MCKKNKDYKLKKLLRAMRRVKRFFHFTRNNPCHTQRFYHEFIEAIGGYGKWQNLRPEIRSAWNAAAGSFDKQYGLVKAWRKIKFKWEMYLIEDLCGKPDVEALNNTAQELKELADRLEKLLKGALEDKTVDVKTLSLYTIEQLDKLANEMEHAADKLKLWHAAEEKKNE